MKTHAESQGHPHSRASAKQQKRRKRNLIALGTAAVVAAYSAGYVRTAEAARRLAAEELPHSGDAVRIAQLDRALQSISDIPATRPGREAGGSPVQTADPAQGGGAPESIPSLPIAPAGGAPVMALPMAMATQVALPVEAPARKYKDGAWFGWGYCRHGELKVIIEIKDDVIIAARIDECYTRYSKNVISALPKRVIERQSPNVDWISGATQSSDAFYYAVVEALKAAKL